MSRQNTYTRELLRARPASWGRSEPAPPPDDAAGAAAGRRTRRAIRGDHAGRQVDRPMPSRIFRSRFGAATTLGLVGESGSGKSTVCRGADRPRRTGRGHRNRWTVWGPYSACGVYGREGAGAAGSGLVFQDPFLVAEPTRRGVQTAIDEPFARAPTRDRANVPVRARGGGGCSNSSAFPTVRSRPRYPHELSGGQRQAREHRPARWPPRP